MARFAVRLALFLFALLNFVGFIFLHTQLHSSHVLESSEGSFNDRRAEAAAHVTSSDALPTSSFPVLTAVPEGAVGRGPSDTSPDKQQAEGSVTVLSGSKLATDAPSGTSCETPATPPDERPPAWSSPVATVHVVDFMARRPPGVGPPPHADPDSVPPSPLPDLPSAFTTIVANDKYIDGAIALGYSLGLASPLVRGKKARFAAVVPRSVHPESRARLAAVGFDVVVLDRSLAAAAPRSWWAMTLDKIQLLNLTMYAKVAFVDADVIAVASPDHLLHVDLPSPWWIGGTARGSGFGTGTMVLRPDAEVCAAMVHYTVNAVRNRSDTRGFGTPNLRDGLAFRWFFGRRHQTVSAGNLMHYSGGWKPWYDVRNNKAEVRHLPGELQGAVTEGSSYALWWWHYLAAHKRYLQGPAQEAEWARRWGPACRNSSIAPSDPPRAQGGAPLPSGPLGPRTHVWMVRHTKWEYVLPIADIERRLHQWPTDLRGELRADLAIDLEQQEPSPVARIRAATGGR
eukprot:TRINITY_DN69530_c0_g1_i1.p1 TRINITY_DN69530_c0_g1~~TRINITY_DN69530_c0_g1_i1.p1  ORF type:complete len:513 (-),score=58.40 TRINITY_DN69530_c0_g1_i1:39-1577(-)